MRRTLHKGLTPAQVKTLSEPGRYSDGGGLMLRVARDASKAWYIRYRINGEPHHLPIGRYPEIGLADARREAVRVQQLAQAGIDPQTGQLAEAHSEPEPTNTMVSCVDVPSFRELAEDAIGLRSSEWTSRKQAREWRRSLELHAFPRIGDKRVNEITSADVLKCIEPLLAVKPEMAARVRQRTAAVLDLGVARGYRTDNPAGQSLARALPKRRPAKNRRRALHYSDVPGVRQTVRQSSSATEVTWLAFEFLVLTGAKPGEVRHCRWSEIDLDAATWTIPSGKKNREPRVIPLSRQSCALLSQAMDLRDGEWVFPSERNGGPLGKGVFGQLLDRLEIDASPDAFRWAFLQWAASDQTASVSDTDDFDTEDVLQRWADFLGSRRTSASVSVAHRATEPRENPPG